MTASIHKFDSIQLLPSVMMMLLLLLLLFDVPVCADNEVQATPGKFLICEIG